MRFDNDSAEMVEWVLRNMFVAGYRAERSLLQSYYPKGMTIRELGKELGVHHTTVFRHRKPMAERIFSEQWAKLIRD